MCVAFFISLASHAILYRASDAFCKRTFASYARLKDDDERRNWNSRVVSTFHAVFAVWSSLWILDRNGTDIVLGFGLVEASENTFLVWDLESRNLLYASLGYFCYDIVLVMYRYPRLGGREFVWHHCAAIFCLLLGLWTDRGHLVLLASIASEMSTPYVNARYFLQHIGSKGTIAYLLNGAALWTVWLVSRIYVFGSVSVFMFYNANMLSQQFGKCCAAVLLVSVIILNVLSMTWFWKISKGLWKILRTCPLHERTKIR